MKVTFYGTRGSCPVACTSKIKYGGNTTCLRIESPCLPAGQWLVIDAGTGIVPLSADFVQGGEQEVTILQTHYHHDHTQGLALSTFPYLKQVPVNIYGPKDQGIGPRVAKVVGAKALGLTHHDPASSDALVDEIVETARGILAADGTTIPVFGCRDYMVVEIENLAGALA